MLTFGQYMDKRIRVIFRDGGIYEGIAKDFSSALDNPDGVATICVGDTYEFREDEIANIELAYADVPETAHAV